MQDFVPAFFCKNNPKEILGIVFRDPDGTSMTSNISFIIQLFESFIFMVSESDPSVICLRFSKSYGYKFNPFSLFYNSFSYMIRN